MKLWLDDVREPWRYGCVGWQWARTAKEAIEFLQTGKVTQASLDHDLAPEHYPWSGVPLEQCQGTGYDVVCWMEENSMWPKDGVVCHSQNPVGRARMEAVINKYYANTSRSTSKG